MIEGLKPYTDYKDSGQEWLGDVPAHWDVRRTKLLLREMDSRSTTGKEQLLRVSQYTGVTRRKTIDGIDTPDTRAASLVGYKRVSANDLVINIMLAWNGSLGASPYDGIVSPAYCVYRLNIGLQPRYFHELLRLPLYKGRIKTASTGVVESRLRLYSDDLGRIEALLPPPDEQAAIVRFLDHVSRRIDGFIRAKRKLVALVNEQKQGIIQSAVTRGLDPDVALKPSGIDWLGDIPEHWELRRAKQLCSRIVDCKNRTPEQIEGGEYVVVRTTNIRNGRFAMRGSYPTDRKNFAIWTERGAPRSGDVFFTREAPMGEACLVPDRTNLCMGQRMMYMRPDPRELEPDFLLFSIYGPVVRMYIRHVSNGSTVGHLRLGQVGAMPLLWCPVEEQRRIVARIRADSAPLDEAITRTEREIALMQEYRTRLTADIVTGKLDVRETAADLPEITEPSSDASDMESAEDELEVEDAP